jgi:uncharacterized membrane protein
VIGNPKHFASVERKIITALFSAGQSRWMSSLSNSFYVNLPTLRDYLYESMITHGYFTHRPDSVRTGYQTAGIVIFAAGVFLAIFAGSAGIIPVGWSLALALCGIILAIAARMMPKKTAKGKNALLAVRGFEEYISRAERQEIEYQERNNYFEKFLPYAMAFGIAAKWAKAFDGIQTTPPSWYSGNAGVFYPSIFAHDMTAASANWQSDMVSQPRSSGSDSGSSFYSGGSGFSGGSSGGGGGGGGGGGW